MILRMILITLLLASCGSAHAEEAPVQRKCVGLVRGRFDHIETLLNHYKIPFETIQFADLEKKDTLKKHIAVFFPCGLGRSLESNINVSASGYYVQNVSLKDLQKKVESEKISENIRNFISSGGSAYFSDFSYDVLQQTYNCFDFYFNFPNLGISGTYTAQLHGPLRLFRNRDRAECYMPHEGWVLMKSVKDAQTLAEGKVETPRGEMHAHLISMLQPGSGEVIYSSYHSSAIDDEIMRYMIFRITRKTMLEYHSSAVSKWNQDITSELLDSILPGENVRTHAITLRKGKNTIYFYAERGLFQIDLYTKEMNLVLSKDTGSNIFSIDVHAAYSGEYILSLYGSGDYLYAPFAVTAAAGWRLIPYITAVRVVLALLAIFIVSVIITAYRLSHPKEIGGRIRR